MLPASRPSSKSRQSSASALVRSVAAAATALSLALLSLVAIVGGATGASAAVAPTVRVVGNQLVDGAGATVRLLGVNKSGGEFACAQGWGFFDGPVDSATVSTIRSWGANAVRVPLNEQCWLGINGMSATFSGQAYRDAVTAFVGRLNAAGVIAIVDLHWNAPGTVKATSQQDMADADHAPDFWRSVAAHFAANPSVVFDLYNEPHDISWQCWRDGCTTRGGWRAAGMQSLVDAVRSTGARQPLILSGLNWGGDLSQWLAYKPNDPLDQLVAGAHIYNFSQCSTAACWDQTIGATAAKVPVVTTEVGEDTCSGGFTSSYLDWADRTGVGYTAWTWNTWDCGGPALITAYDGTPTALGAVVKARLQALASTSAIASAPVSSSPAAASPSTTSPTTTATAAPTPTPSPTATPTASPTPTATATPTSTPTSTAPTTSTLVYGFETALAPWKAESSGITLQRTSYLPYRGSWGMVAARSVAARAWSAIRLNTAGTPLQESAGRTVSAWVRLDGGTPGTWKAGLEIQDASWRWVAGPTAALVPGSWTRVTFTVPTSTWSGHKALGIQVGGSRPTSGTVKVRFDEIRQSG